MAARRNPFKIPKSKRHQTPLNTLIHRLEAKVPALWRSYSLLMANWAENSRQASVRFM